MRFPPEFIQRLRDIVVTSEVVGKRVTLRQHGKEQQGLCPFHKEKTPSFTVNDAKGFYHCFGCGAHGDGIRFLMEYERLSYPEAVQRLAEEYGLPIPKPDPKAEQKARRQHTLQQVMEQACQWFEQQLFENKVAQGYLKSRGIAPNTAQSFRIGFAAEGQQGLIRALTQQGVDITLLQEAGLTSKRDSGDLVDKFRGRVVFPIHNRRGQVIAFGGRAMGGRQPKYLNSPETPLFSKRHTLYNLDKAFVPAQKTDQLLVTEGYMDVIALYQAGFEQAVAPLGTAVSAEQLQMLWRVNHEPVFCLDGDTAGLRAMAKAAELALPLLQPGYSLQFCLLPEGEDPDSVLRSQGREGMGQLLAQPLSLAQMLLRLHQDDPMDTPERFAALSQRLHHYADQIRHEELQAAYHQWFKKALLRLQSKRNRQPVSQQKSDALVSRKTMAVTRLARSKHGGMEELKTIFAILYAHPHLLEVHEEAVAGLHCPAPQLYRVQQCFLEALLASESHEEEAIRHYLCAHVPDITRLLPNLGHWDAITAERQLVLCLANVTLQQLQQDYAELQQQLGQDMTEVNWNRLQHMQKEILRMQQIREHHVQLCLQEV